MPPRGSQLEMSSLWRVQKRHGGWRMHAKVDGKRVDGPLRATEELANEDLAEARRGTRRADFVTSVRRMHTRLAGQGRPKKTLSSLGSVQQIASGKLRLRAQLEGLQLVWPARPTRANQRRHDKSAW